MIHKLRTRLQGDEGFTLIELLVVIIIIGILLAIAVPSYLKFKDRAYNATAQSNLRIALPAVEEYAADNTASPGGYTGMTIALLQGYDASIDSTKLSIVGTPDATSYCLESVDGSATYYKDGPNGDITTTACT